MDELLPAFIELGLLIYCLIDAITTPAEDCRNLAKTWWILLIIFVPVIGCIAWLVAGHPWPQQGTARWSPGSGFPEPARPIHGTTEIDAQLAADLRRVDEEHADMLRRWEADLKSREERGATPDEPGAAD